MSTEKGTIGSSFESFLKDQGTFEETTAISIKRVIAWQLEQAMEHRTHVLLSLESLRLCWRPIQI